MKNFTKKLAGLIVLIAVSQLASAQVKVGENPTIINKASLLELESANKGLLFPRVNLTNTITWSLSSGSVPVAGMMVYNIKTIASGFSGTTAYPAIAGDGTGIYYWDGNGWVASKGMRGTDGKSVTGAAGAPGASTPGGEGDIYINTTIGDTYIKQGNTWVLNGNIRGPKGDTGATGPKGDTGTQGIQGIPGIQGPKGDTGADGAVGATGPKGDTGSQGPQGIPGIQGPKGDTGADGAVGATGPKGDTGSQGPQGLQGIQGPKGDTGADGAVGATGPKGDTGSQGPQGLQGPKGDTGTDGAVGATGPKGDTGSQGPEGIQGPKGDTGSQGPKGDTGTTDPVTADNGLTKTGDNIQLGGALIKPTTITTDGTQTLAIAGLQPGVTTGTTPDKVVVADPTTGVLKSVELANLTPEPWKLKGNLGTNPAGGTTTGTDFLGTIDAKDFQIKVNNADIMRVKSSNGHVQFGNRKAGASNTQDADAENTPTSFLIGNTFGASDLSIGTIIHNFRTRAQISAPMSKVFYGGENLIQLNEGSTQSIFGQHNRVEFNGAGKTYTTPASSFYAVNHNSGVVFSGVTVSPAVGTNVQFNTMFNIGTITTRTVLSRNDFSGNGTYDEATGVASRHGAGIFAGSRSNSFLSEFTGGSYPTAGSRQISFYSNIADSDIKNGYGLYIENVAGTESQHGIMQVGADDANHFAGNTVIGSNAVSATNKLHVVSAANPVRFEGLQAGIPTDRVVVADATGVLKTVAPASLAAPEPWRIQTTSNNAVANTDKIYQNNKVAIGDFSGAESAKMLEVKGDFKSEVAEGAVIYGSEVKSPLIPQSAGSYWVNTATGERHIAGVTAVSSGISASNATVNSEHSNTTALSGSKIENASVISSISADLNQSSMQSMQKDNSAYSTIRTTNTGNFFMETYNVASNFGSTLSLQNTGLRLVHTNTNGQADPFPNNNRTELLVQKTNGIGINLRDASGAAQADYFLPTTSGTAGQVLTKGTSNNTLWATPTAVPRFFYAPSVVLPTTNVSLPANVTYAGGVFTVDLYAIYNYQFSMAGETAPTKSAIKSASAGTLDVVPANGLGYFVTYFDNTVFDPASITLSDAGILTYKILPSATVTDKTFMNIVFKVK